jgi:SdpC family antimicrobial peptide
MLYRNRSLRVAGAYVMLASFAVGFLTSCAEQAVGPEARTPAAPANRLAGMTGEEAFRGIFFGEGRVAAALPEIWEGKSLEQRTSEKLTDQADRLAALRAGMDEMVARIAAADPTFFPRFGQAVQSGDRLKVGAAIDEAAALIKKGTQGNVRLGDGRPQSVYVLWFYYGIAVYEIAVLVIAATPLSAQLLVKGRAESPLRWDMLIDAVARNLAAPAPAGVAVR